MTAIPADYRDLFERDAIAHFGTMLPNRFPHITPVWVSYDEGRAQVLVNTARGRRKERNVRDDPRVGMSIVDPDDPYRYCSIAGQVVEITTEGAVDHIDRLAKRYMGVEEYPNHGEEDGERVIIAIEPQHIMAG